MPEWPRRPRKVDDERSSRFTIRRLRSRPVELTAKGLRHRGPAGEVTVNSARRGCGGITRVPLSMLHAGVDLLAATR